MPSKPEYYRNAVQRLTSAPLALLCMVTLPAICAAQFGSSSASASSGTGGHFATGSVPSATGAVNPFTGTVAPATGSVRPPTGGPNFSAGVPDSRVTFHGTNSIAIEHHHHDHSGKVDPAVAYGYAVPYAYPIDAGTDEDNSDADDDTNYQGGPTVFDRRGSGARSYVPPVETVPTPHASQLAEDTAPQPPTLVVFKDGHTLELGNYAIIGTNLFDLTPGHARKIALADLDLEATRKQNEDRGVSFQLPPPPQAN